MTLDEKEGSPMKEYYRRIFELEKSLEHLAEAKKLTEKAHTIVPRRLEISSRDVATVDPINAAEQSIGREIKVLREKVEAIQNAIFDGMKLFQVTFYARSNERHTHRIVTYQPNHKCPEPHINELQWRALWAMFQGETDIYTKVDFDVAFLDRIGRVAGWITKNGIVDAEGFHEPRRFMPEKRK